MVSLFQYFFPLTYIKFLLLRQFTLYSAAKSENVFYFTDKSKEALNRYGINHTRFHQFENSAIWNPAESTQNSRNTTNDCKVHTHDTLETSKCFTESFNSSTERSNSFIKPSPYTYHYRSDSIESEHIQGQFVSHSVNYFSKIPLSRNEAGESGSDHFNNTFEKEILEKIFHSGSDVPNDTTKQNSISAATPERPDYLNLLYVAELLPYKNHLILFAAVHDLLIEGYKISLTLVGDLHNSYSRKIIEFRNSLGFADEITFLGSLPHEELLKIYPLYDCLVYPSLVESLGIPIYEAIAFGLPIICSNYIDFIPDTDSSSISLFNPQSKDELKNCIKNLYSQKFPLSYLEPTSPEIYQIEIHPIELSPKGFVAKF
jgi:glycosyltransferase involved in cell wall biosynthesis